MTTIVLKLKVFILINQRKEKPVVISHLLQNSENNCNIVKYLSTRKTAESKDIEKMTKNLKFVKYYTLQPKTNVYPKDLQV